MEPVEYTKVNHKDSYSRTFTSPFHNPHLCLRTLK